MAVSKVILNGTTLIDVTQKTVTSNNLLSPNTALNAAGSDVVGGIATKSAADLVVDGAVVTVPSGYYATAASANVESMTAEEIWIAAASGWGSTNPSVSAAIWNSIAAGWSVSATMTDSTIHTSVASGWR